MHATTSVTGEIGTKGRSSLIMLSLLHHLRLLLLLRSMLSHILVLVLHHRNSVLVLWRRRWVHLTKGAKLSLLLLSLLKLLLLNERSLQLLEIWGIWIRSSVTRLRLGHLLLLRWGFRVAIDSETLLFTTCTTWRSSTWTLRTRTSSSTDR